MTSSQSSLKEVQPPKDFKGFNQSLGSDSGGAKVTNVHASFSPPASAGYSAPGFGPGMGPCMCQCMGLGMGAGMGMGMGPGMGTGMGPDMGVDPSVFAEDVTDQAQPMDKEAMNQALMAALNSRFRRFVGISANLTAQWKNQNILGEFEVNFITDSGCRLTQQSSRSYFNVLYQSI